MFSFATENAGRLAFWRANVEVIKTLTPYFKLLGLAILMTKNAAEYGAFETRQKTPRKALA